MMRRFLLATCLAAILPTGASAAEDPGQTPIGQVSVTVYHATDGDPGAAGAGAREVDADTAARLRLDPRLGFAHYRLLGTDTQPLLRSYESWAQPLKPSDELLVRFEAQAEPTDESMMLDLELWLSRKKIIKADARLERDRPLFMLGPEWRGGRLIIAVALASDEKNGS